MVEQQKKQALTNYANLQEKVSATFAQIHERQKPNMSCGRGCASCCIHGLTVSNLEAAAISEHLQRKQDPIDSTIQPTLKIDSRSSEMQARSHLAGRCEFLDQQMNCTIYEVRPLICRSHGAPIVVKNDEGERQFDVCPLNFESVDLNSLPLTDIINVDTINMLLALLNKQYDSANSEQRWPLNPRSLAQFR